MNCLSCNIEYSGDLDSCEQCGSSHATAPDAQPFEVIHCTACGARQVQDARECEQCGEPMQTADEWVVGSCLNCGGEWRCEWQYCRHCGVFSANALIDETISMPAGRAGYAYASGPLFTAWEAEPVSSRRCPECDAALMAEANFCNQCGIRVRPSAVELPDVFGDEADDDAAEPEAATAFSEGATAGAEPEVVGEGADAAAESEPELTRPGYRGKPRWLSRRARRRLRTVAAVVLIAVILLFAYLIASETQIYELFDKLR